MIDCFSNPLPNTPSRTPHMGMERLEVIFNEVLGAMVSLNAQLQAEEFSLLQMSYKLLPAKNQC